jgi:transcriptional regulator with XRE-family HTH domain
MRLRTRVFELAADYGYASDRQLARAMGVEPSTVSRVRSGESGVSPEFITGARRAFPDKTLDDLFYVETVTADSAAG